MGTRTSSEPETPFLADRLPPQAVQAEQAVLSAALMDEEACRYVLRTLRERDFYHGAHRLLFSTLGALMARGVTPNFVTVLDELERQGQVMQVGGLDALTSLASGPVFLPSQVGHNAQPVLRTAAYRDGLEFLQKMLGRFWEQDDEPDALREEVLRWCLESREARDDGEGWTDLRFVASDVALHIREGEGAPALEIGIRPLDEMGGLERGEVGIICGIPGSGKTALTVQWMEHAAETWGPVALFSLEMRKDSLARRLLAAGTGFSYQELREAKRWEDGRKRPFTAREQEAVVSVALRIGQLRHALWVDDRAYRLKQIVARAHEVCADPFGAQAIFLDYGQLVIDDTGEGKSRVEELESVARGLKNLIAGPLQVPVVVLVQPTGESIRRGVLKMGDMRGSSEWLAVANMLWLINLDPEEKETEQTVPIRLDIAKSRNGAREGVPLTYHKARFRFAPRDVEHDVTGYEPEPEYEDRRALAYADPFGA